MTRSKITKIIIGVLLLAVGALWLLEAIGVLPFDFTLLFDGWWAVLLMIIFLISIVSDGPDFGNILFFCVSFILFLNARDLIPENFNLWLLLFSLALLFVGGKIILGAFKKSGPVPVHQAQIYTDDTSSAHATFAAEDVNHTHSKYLFTNETVRFAGVTVGKLSFEANFSSLTLDFTGAFFTEESSVTVSTNFGETKILLPAGVRAEVTQDATFGSVKNMSVGSAASVQMKLTCAFGAVSVKNV